METKACSKCKEPKPLSEFYFRNRDKGTRHHYCKQCLKGYKDAHYQNNKGRYLERCGKRRDKMKQEVDEKLVTYLTEHSCVDCSEDDPIVLEFDHNEPSGKVLSISTMRLRSYSWASILAEINKCSVRCANCHRRRTAKQFNWYRQK